MKVHLEGMGVNGTLLARQLELRGVDFTWDDLGADVSAWKACTGAIYPGGSEKFGPDTLCHSIWKNWHEWRLYGQWTEKASFVFTSKSPPHGGRYAHEEFAPGVRKGAEPSIHFNAQGAVPDARERWASKRVAGTDTLAARLKADHVIVTHGWTTRLSHVYWGWTRLVKLAWDRGLGMQRPALYHRPHKFLMVYAYPVPNTPWWYAGSSIIKQNKLKAVELATLGKYERWEAAFDEAFEGSIRVAERGEFLQGWRPAASDEEWLTGDIDGRHHTMRPLWNSGVRHFPKQLAHVLQALDLPVGEDLRRLL